ncbi:porin [Manganibacter manganicus]|uniref:Porin n=1 Tax=Manganibacter manganicus TaxID=1873176 RepID=A0A1V8RK34_9HYPH|nr:porin [Pseudaminobacter manganicus]OQM73572.1 porin [Pseudaminobacter manganicus]
MNIKSLLLGSAAALLAVSGARAADAVVYAEPEPAEYVKICDVYGAGYFYIPGTETCLRIGGYLRYDAGFGEIGSFTGDRTADRMDGSDNDTWHKQARFALHTYTASETELGTLKTFTETRFNYTDGQDRWEGRGGNGVDVHFAWMQLGGLRIGLDESAYDTFTGYAGNVINDTLVPYGGFRTNLISYTFDAGNGFSALVSFEQGNDDGYSLVRRPGDTYVLADDVIDSYMPHVVLGAKYTQGWGGISGVVAYNSNYEEWAGKVRLDVNATQQLTLFIMGGYGTDDEIDRNFYKPWGGNWAVWGGGSYQVNEKTALNLQVSYDDSETLGVAANVAYEVVPGFKVTAEVDYVNQSFDNQAKYGSWTGLEDEDSIGGVIRFQRNF